MKHAVSFSFCDVLAEFICRHPSCEVVIPKDNIAGHLRRKHKIATVLAKEEAKKITAPFADKVPLPIAEKYLNEPMPRIGEQPLPALPGLPLHDIVQCMMCSLYFKGYTSLRNHIRSSHYLCENVETILSNIRKLPLHKGQALFSGPRKLFFPVSTSSPTLTPPSDEESHPSPSILFGRGQERQSNSDSISLKERSANLCTKVLRIPEFLDSHDLTIEDAKHLSAVEDRSTLSRVSKLLVTYVQYFTELNPPIPLSVVEAVKIRDKDTTASFSLGLKTTSKERYARVLARFAIVLSKFDSSLISRFHLNHTLRSKAEDLISLPPSSDGFSTNTLSYIHCFCRQLLLRGACASQGEILPLESLFKIILAGYAYDVKNKRVRVGDSDDASHTAASLQYFCHICALGEFLVRPVGFGEHNDEGDHKRLQLVREMVSTESYTPASYLRIVLLKTKRISAGESPTVNFVPCKDHSFCGSVENIEVQMNTSRPGSLGYAVRQIANDVQQIIRHDLMRDYSIPSHFAQTILSFPDRYNVRDSGYFFGSDGKAKTTMQTWADDFARHLSRCQNAVIEHLVTNGTEEWRPSCYAGTWLRAANKLSTLLYVLAHICGGGPPRVTEMIDSKLRNTAGSRRNLFIINRCLAIIGVYSKTSEQFEKPKPIARFLNHHTTELFLLYIVYIKPTQSFLLGKMTNEIDASDDYLFCQGGSKFDEKVLCREFANILSSKGVPFTVSMYRHYRTGITKAFLASEKSHSFEELAFRQAGHTEITAQMRYAGGSFSFEDLSMAKLEGFYVVSRQWHELLGFEEASPSFNLNKTDRQPLSEKQKRARKNSIQPTQLREKVFLVSSQVQNNFDDCHQVNTPKAMVQGNKGQILSRTRPSSDDYDSCIQVTKKQRIESFVQTNPSLSSQFLTRTLFNSVRKVLGLNESEHLSFKSAAQRAAVCESTMHTLLTGFGSTMLVILPTGGGKSLCWVAPVLREQQIWAQFSMKTPITIVIVPLIALQQDILRKCSQYGIRCSEWNERFTNDAAVVVSSVDVVFTNEYDRYITTLIAKGRLARIVVDEVHLLLQWKTLRRFTLIGPRLRPNGARDVPLLLMSATVTGAMVSDLQDLLTVEMSCFKTYRALNSRPNISYNVVFVDCVRMEKMVEICASIIHEKATNLSSKDRVIAYCLTIKECKQIHAVLTKLKKSYEVCIYYGSMSHEDRRANYDKWISKDSDVPVVMASTSAFSCGVDYDHVRVVLHVGGARTIVELAQESGRLGRDGAPSTDIVVYNEHYLDNSMRLNEKGETNTIPISSFGDIKLFLNKNKRCRRQILESFLNDTARGPCERVELKCDVCYQHKTIEFGTKLPRNFQDFGVNCEKKTIPRIVPTQSRVTAPEVPQRGGNSGGIPCVVFGFDKADAIWKAKQLARTKCAVCLFARAPLKTQGTHTNCMRAMCYRCLEASAKHQSSNCKITPRSTASFKRCFFCGIPQSKDLHEPGTFDKRDKCEWNVAKNLAFLCWRSPRYRSQLCAQLPCLRGCQDMAEIGRLLCGGERANEIVNMARAVEYLYRTFVLRIE